MDSLKDTINLVLEDLKHKHKESDQDKIVSLLKKSFSPRELKHIKPISLRAGILRLNVDSSVWLYQLNLKKEQVINKIKSELNSLKDIYFRLGDIR